MLDALDEPIARLFQAAQRIQIVSHIRPDGDAIGSLLGLGLSLEEVGKEVQMVLVDGVSHSFRHLPGSQKIVRKPSGVFDAVVVVDCSDLARTGGAVTGQPDLNIDHHITNLNFARLNYVRPDVEATAAILTEALPRWGLPIDEPVSKGLLTGIVSDTLGFRTSNVTPHTLRLAADLMEKGANLAEMTNIGTLFAFVIVCAGVLKLAPQEKNTKKAFRIPYINGKYIVPIMYLVVLSIFLVLRKDTFWSLFSFQGGWEVFKHKIPYLSIRNILYRFPSLTPFIPGKQALVLLCIYFSTLSLGIFANIL